MSSEAEELYTNLIKRLKERLNSLDFLERHRQSEKDAVEVLKRRDFNGSRRLIEYDRQVNHKRFAIEHDTLMIGDAPLVKPLIDVPRMAEKACEMLHRALDAFDRRDIELAAVIPSLSLFVAQHQIIGAYGHIYFDSSGRFLQT